MRIKGIKIHSARLKSDGTKSYVPYEVADNNANCKNDNWGKRVLCGANKLATGLVIHYRNNSGKYEFKGLELICRRIGLE